MPQELPNPTPGTAAPPQPAAVLPILHTNDARVMPRRYLIHKHSQHCKGCGTLHEWSAAYAYNEMATRTGAGKLVINLVPVTEFRFNLPIQVVAVARREIPVCHECASSASLLHLPDPRGTDEWRRIYAVAQAPETSRTLKPRTKALPKTIDDLLF